MLKCKNLNLYKLLKDSCEKYSNNILFEFQDKKINYNQFFIDVLNFAKQNSFKDSNILILGNSSYEWAIAYFSVAISSGIAILGQINLSHGELVSLCSKCKIKTIICEPQALNIKNINIIKFDNIKINNMQKFDCNNNLDYENIPDKKLCTIAFTSGTTDESKGVMLSHKNLYCNVHAGCDVYEYKNNDVILNILPFFHMFGLVCVLLASIISGSKIVFSNLNNFFNDMKFVKPSFIHLVPEMVKFLLKRIQALGLQEATGGNLKKIMCGGAQIDKNTVEDYKNFGITVSGCYGITECSPCISINALQKNKNGTAGIALPCNKIKIADNNQEILVKGDNVMIGYYENEELTKQVITDGWFHTGDIGFIEDGFLTVTGRIKNLIVLESGKKINPEEIENMFLGCSEINEIIVYEYKNQIHAKIFSKNFIKNEIQKIIDQVNSKLPMYKRINKFELSDVPLEKTSINKIKRRKSNYES